MVEQRWCGRELERCVRGRTKNACDGDLPRRLPEWAESSTMREIGRRLNTVLLPRFSAMYCCCIALLSVLSVKLSKMHCCIALRLC